MPITHRIESSSYSSENEKTFSNVVIPQQCSNFTYFTFIPVGKENFLFFFTKLLGRLWRELFPTRSLRKKWQFSTPNFLISSKTTKTKGHGKSRMTAKLNSEPIQQFSKFLSRFSMKKTKKRASTFRCVCSESQKQLCHDFDNFARK